MLILNDVVAYLLDQMTTIHLITINYRSIAEETIVEADWTNTFDDRYNLEPVDPLLLHKHH